MAITVTLTEQQARSVAAAARVALRHEGYRKSVGPGDAAAGFVGCGILESAVEASIGAPVAHDTTDA